MALQASHSSPGSGRRRLRLLEGPEGTARPTFRRAGVLSLVVGFFTAPSHPRRRPTWAKRRGVVLGAPATWRSGLVTAVIGGRERRRAGVRLLTTATGILATEHLPSLCWHHQRRADSRRIVMSDSIIQFAGQLLQSAPTSSSTLRESLPASSAGNVHRVRHYSPSWGCSFSLVGTYSAALSQCGSSTQPRRAEIMQTLEPSCPSSACCAASSAQST
jgi:hypothetical protein